MKFTLDGNLVNSYDISLEDSADGVFGMTYNGKDLVITAGGDGTFIKTIDGLFNLKYHLGVDFSIESVKLCKEKGLTVSRSDAWSMNKFEDKFNLITLTHVLEHIPNPREVINKIE